jgi:hypothetical protein
VKLLKSVLGFLIGAAFLVVGAVFAFEDPPSGNAGQFPMIGWMLMSGGAFAWYQVFRGRA